MRVCGNYRTADKTTLYRLTFRLFTLLSLGFYQQISRDNYSVVFNPFFQNNDRHILQFASIVGRFCAAIAKKITWKTTCLNVFSVCSGSLWETGIALRQTTQIERKYS